MAGFAKLFVIYVSVRKVALPCNLTGAMPGGLLEYNSMEFGFAFLVGIGPAESCPPREKARPGTTSEL